MGSKTKYGGSTIAKFHLLKKTTNSHLSKKYITEGRQNIIHRISEVLSKPNEVFFIKDGPGGKMRLRYIKFYKEKIMNVVAGLQQDGLSINTWHFLDKNINEKRTGILIKKL
jgi:hypothetical protein